MSNTSTYFKLNGRPSVIKHLFLEYKFLNMTTMKNLHFLKQLFLLHYTLANLNFCKLLKPFFPVPNSLVNTWFNKALIYFLLHNSSILYVNPFALLPNDKA